MKHLLTVISQLFPSILVTLVKTFNEGHNVFLLF